MPLGSGTDIELGHSSRGEEQTKLASRASLEEKDKSGFIARNLVMDIDSDVQNHMLTQPEDDAKKLSCPHADWKE
nr:hypothetical protein CFP56_44322 [Quercus suber]